MLGCGCAIAPPRVPPGAEQVATVERWPTAEEIGAWTVSMDEALRIARDAQVDQDPRHMKYRVSPVVRGSEQFWRVTGASVIAGSWDAEVDARSGSILRTRHFRGR